LQLPSFFLCKNKSQKICKIHKPQKPPTNKPSSPDNSPHSNHKKTTFTAHISQKPSKKPPQKNPKQNPHQTRFPPDKIHHLRVYTSKDMSTSTISVDEFQALEQKVLRAVEIIKQEREARAKAEAEAASLREQLEFQTLLATEAQASITTLNKERDGVRQRVEKMLQQMDDLL
jgi:flagellar biosynthesis/type III secretory pathway protein FliH